MPGPAAVSSRRSSSGVRPRACWSTPVGTARTSTPSARQQDRGSADQAVADRGERETDGEGLAPVQPVHVTKREDPADRGDHVWVWLAEIFPLHMRGLGIGISVFFGWTTHGILALFFPSLVKGIGITGSFFMFAVIGVAALVFVWTKVPETRGRSLEALEEDVTTGEIYIGMR
ncbi:hypothetical protein EEB14_55850 [Rhodococcus sp. WS4]|nr:hypothetical protein EEB14_55850 [Rhodococcus sp. WS4]